MPISLAELKSELEALPVGERAELAHFLIGSLDEREDADSEAAWDAELTRRVDEIKGGNVVGKPAEQVFAELREKYP